MKRLIFLSAIIASLMMVGCGDRNNDDDNPVVATNGFGQPLNNNCLNNGFIDPNSGQFTNCANGICDTNNNINNQFCTGFNNGFINQYPFQNGYFPGYNNGFQNGFNRCPVGYLPVYSGAGLGCVPVGGNGGIRNQGYQWAFWQWDAGQYQFNRYRHGGGNWSWPSNYNNGYYGIQACNPSGGCDWPGTSCAAQYGLCHYNNYSYDYRYEYEYEYSYGYGW